MMRALLILSCALSFGCGRLAGASSGDAGVTLATAPPGQTNVQTATNTAPPPADAPAFLDRFCSAVAAGDRAYVLAHTDNGVFSSRQGPDPESPTPGRRFTQGGGHHADADFNPVCARIRAQRPGEIAKRVRQEDGLLLVRLRNDGKASDLIIERRGADFRLLREEAPREAKRTGGGGGGGGW